MDAELEDWADRLEAIAASTRFDPTRVRVFATCESTQEPARDLGIGSVVTTGRQTAGRGRLGRVWVEDRGTGIALSLGLPAMASDRACIAVAVASMEAVAPAAMAEPVSPSVAPTPPPKIKTPPPKRNRRAGRRPARDKGKKPTPQPALTVQPKPKPKPQGLIIDEDL